jgi:hypothetical protein
MCIILVLLSSFLNVFVGGSVLVGQKRYMMIIEKEKLVSSTLQTTNNVPQIESFCVSGQFFVKESKNIPQEYENFAREEAKYFYFRNNGCFFSPIDFHGGRKRLGGGSSAFIWEIVVESLGVLLFMSFNDGKILKIVELTARKPVWLVSCLPGYRRLIFGRVPISRKLGI